MARTVRFLPHFSPSVPETRSRIAKGSRYAVKVHPIVSVEVRKLVLNSGNIGKTSVAPNGPMNPPTYSGRFRIDLST